MRRAEEIQKEMELGERAERQGNSGRARVCARRAAGMALEDYYSRMGKDPGKDAMKLLAQFSGENDVPAAVHEAAVRLQERVRPDFTSASQHPLMDARLILDYLNARS